MAKSHGEKLVASRKGPSTTRETGGSCIQDERNFLDLQFVRGEKWLGNLQQVRCGQKKSANISPVK